MNETFIRTAQLLGDQGFSRLSSSVVAVFGLGGVGSHCAEALARSGVGTLFLIDSDTVAPSNINRQSIALLSTVGQKKTDVMKEKIADINPECSVFTSSAFVIPILSSMGTGNKLHPEAFRIGDIYSTSVCPLCRVMRRELKKREIPALKVLYSEETPRRPETPGETKGSGRPAPASIAFVPPVAGLLIAGEVIRELSGTD